MQYIFVTRKELEEVESKFTLAWNHLCILNYYISKTQCRFDRAKINGQRSFRYSLRIKLFAMEETRNMFYEHVDGLAEQLSLIMEHGYILDEEDSEDEQSIVDGI